MDGITLNGKQPNPPQPKRREEKMKKLEIKKFRIKLTTELLADLFGGKRLVIRTVSQKGRDLTEIEIMPPKYGYFISVEDMGTLERLAMGLPLGEMAEMVQKIRESASKESLIQAL